jgi:DNA-binding winged helix-turn-helix (wHTH) protein/tetratricopeptide (TPR) repeat protein
MEIKQRFTFSDFTYDCDTCDLARNGRSLRIPDQTARLLTILLAKGGGLVTREEIRHFLWPDGEHLDYDHSINKTISQLRAILRDDRNKPRFVETIPKRGYRFLGATIIQAPPPPVATTDQLATETVSIANSAPQVSLLPPSAELARPKVPHRGGLTRLWLVWGVAALLVAMLGTGYFLYQRSRPKPPRVVSIGIAPFEFSGNGAEQLSESLRMDLTDAISQLPEVQVRAAHSLEGKQAGDDSIRELAKKLQLDTVIFGRFSLTEDHFSLQLELIRGSDAVHLASFSYEGTRQELPALRNKVQRDIFSHLDLTRGDQQHALGRTSNPHAYESYLRGRYLLAQRTEDSLRGAMGEFKAAANADPHFAAAFAGMAHTEMILAEHEAIPSDEGFIKTRQLANTALQQDPSLAEAHGILGYSAFRLDWDMTTAERELRQAIELDPNQSVYHVWISVLLCDEGRFDESFQQIDQAHALDPLWAPIFLTEAFLGASSRRYDRMLSSANKLVSLMPDWPLAHGQLAWSLWFAGRSEEAIAEWRKMASLEKDTARVGLEDKGLDIFHRQGRRAYAQMRLEACLKGFKSAHANDFVSAEWYAYAGHDAQALQLLEQQVAHHNQDALEFTVNPAFFGLHNNPRFQALVTKIGLPFSSPSARS